MSLTSNTKLGPYEIVSPLGAGGMGEVYRARDSRLDRDVAIKVLPEAMSRDKERVLRFEREAKLLATLSHPNIAAIHGFEEFEGKKILVLEFVDGETLHERLKRGALPIEDALEAAKQVAEALEAAHEKGVIHRDLKPGNVMIKAGGTIKVLDFGLARAMADDISGTAMVGDSPTITAHYTRPGVVLGTAAYMSPEQARGKAVDRRTDIWSFGCLLYECLTGVGPFAGETTTDVIAKVMEREPDYAALPQRTPIRIRELLHRCLEKLPKRRLRDIGDALLELDQAVTKREWSTAVVAVADRRTPLASSKLLLIVSVFAMLLILAAYAGRHVGVQSAEDARSTATILTRGAIVTGLEQLTDSRGIKIDPCLSPDGKMLLYVTRDGDDLDIFLQRVGGSNPINLTADCPFDDSAPAFSPDGNRIAFRSQREGGGLFIMGATGESPQRICDDGFDPTWSPDGTRLVYSTEAVLDPYARNTIAQLWIIDLASREKRLLYKGDAVAPSFSPSGRRIAFWSAIKGIRDIGTVPGTGGEQQSVTNDTYTDWNPFFSPDGRTLYFISDRSGRANLWRVPIDESSGRTLGPPLPVTLGTTPIDRASLSSDGKRIAFTARSTSTEFLRFAFDAGTEKVVGEPTSVFTSSNLMEQFDVTSDGRRLAFRTSAPKDDLVVMDLDSGTRRRLMDDVFRDRGPVWTPDGAWLVFYSNRGGGYDLWRIRPDGTNARKLTSAGAEGLSNPRLSPDGRMIAAGLSTEGGSALVIFNFDRLVSEVEEPVALPEIRTPSFGPVRFSPDQHWLAGWSEASNLLRPVASLYDVQTRTAAILKTSNGQTFESHSLGSSDMDWIDEHRLIFWDEKQRSAFIWDLTTGSAREVPGIPGPCELRVIDGGRGLIVNRHRTESDIWMLQLGDLAEK